MYQLYKSGDRFRVIVDEVEPLLFLYNPQMDNMLHRWKRVADGETVEELGFAIYDYFKGAMTLHQIHAFLSSLVLEPNVHRFGTHKQWRAIARINERHSKDYAPTSYEEMKEILNTWLN